MATAKQKAANKSNAQHSTGPRTPEGKAASSRNHLSHGFASSVNFVRGEEPEAFGDLLTDLLDEYHPATPTEQILVEKMAQNQWLSLRAINLQTDALNAAGPGNPIPTSLGLLLRYQTTADRAFHRAHTELLKAQGQRKNSEIGFEPQNVAEPAAEPAEAEVKTAPATPPQPQCAPDFPAVPHLPARNHPAEAALHANACTQAM